MMHVVNSDQRLLNEHGTMKKIMNNVVVHNVRVGSGDEDVFKKDLRKYIDEDGGESKREVTLNLFRSLLSGENVKVRRLCITAVLRFSKCSIDRGLRTVVLQGNGETKNVDLGRLCVWLINQLLLMLKTLHHTHIAIL